MIAAQAGDMLDLSGGRVRPSPLRFDEPVCRLSPGLPLAAGTSSAAGSAGGDMNVCGLTSSGTRRLRSTALVLGIALAPLLLSPSAGAASVRAGSHPTPWGR